MSKGSKQRPTKVSREQYRSNWERTFRSPEESHFEYNVTLRPDGGATMQRSERQSALRLCMVLPGTPADKPNVNGCTVTADCLKAAAKAAQARIDSGESFFIMESYDQRVASIIGCATRIEFDSLIECLVYTINVLNTPSGQLFLQWYDALKEALQDKVRIGACFHCPSGDKSTTLVTEATIEYGVPMLFNELITLKTPPSNPQVAAAVAASRKPLHDEYLTLDDIKRAIKDYLMEDCKPVEGEIELLLDQNGKVSGAHAKVTYLMEHPTS